MGDDTGFELDAVKASDLGLYGRQIVSLSV